MSLDEWLEPGAKRRLFFIQETPRGEWHVESDEHCEYMLCGKFISVNADVRIKQSWGEKKCFTCFVRLKKRQQESAI